ncbi:MAG TPA: histidine kinase dimerization/phosphoacceptor domain -containing protein [Rectinemataceae bacterium]|nr:histidine kinase dimerization/phosphoacceptor domain -containing protein [Rectinemataceae bacterium]
MGKEPHSILLVEDDPIVAMGLSVELQDEGFRVNSAYSGEMAIAALRQGIAASDLILMDLDLGIGIDGVQAASEILRDHDIPIVFLSSHSEREFAARTEKVPSYGYILKTNGAPVIAAAVKMALAVHERCRGAPRLSPFRNMKRRAEQSLRAALEEKDVLLKELQHRTKNNLGLISSLLTLSLNVSGDESSHRALLEARSRVHAMAAVYETLTYSDSVESVDLEAYFRRFIASLCEGYVIDRDMIAIRTRLEAGELDPKRAVTIGLILNELLTNSLKHAYKPGSRGEILVEVLRRGEELELRVSDQGRGLPPGLDPSLSEGMGFTLVRLLTHQLEGRVQFESEAGNGTRVSVLIGN